MLKAFVRALADEGKIVVFSSHVLEVVEQVCSRVVILKDGRIVGHDSVANLRTTLQPAVARRRVRVACGRRERRGADRRPGVRDALVRAFAASIAGSRYGVLSRAFFGQFFASEAVTSDVQMQKAAVGVLAFLITPGLLMPIQMVQTFEFAAIRFPAMLEPMTRLMATICITYSMTTIGVVAAVMWDQLSFDRRDAMVLGPLPLNASTVVAAKLSAMALFLLLGAAGINLITAVPFSLVAGNHKTAMSVVRLFVAHMVTTMTASAFVFCLLVTLRAVVGGVSGRRVAIASILRFLLFSALLCFIIFMPTALHLVPGGRRRGAMVQMQPIPAWSPTNWFLGLYEWMRGSPGAEWDAGARRAIAITGTMIAASVMTTIAGYRRQLQLALTPSADAGVRHTARLPRAIAAVATGGNRMARAMSTFILTTLARSSAQQATIAVNAAIGLTLVVVALMRGSGDIAQIMRPRTAVLWIPLVLTYWTAIGLRAAFFVPAELPAAWTFRFHGPIRTPAYWSATRAAAAGFLVPAALVADGLIVPLVGVRTAALHATIVVAAATLLAETVAMTIDFVPFTRPYVPGHARLKTRWPVYLIGLYLFAIWPARAALDAVGNPGETLQVAAWLCAAAAALEIGGRWRARAWRMDPMEEFQEESAIAVLDIGMTVQGAERI